MHFEDLEPCRYHVGSHLDADAWAVPFRAIGWLEHPHSFEVGTVPAGFLSRLSRLLSQTCLHFEHYQFRGFYECSLCRAAGRVTRGFGWSQTNLIVPGNREVYVAPGGIVHYVSDHSYCPPTVFLEAVASCPDCGSEQYFDALRRANGGLEPPVETLEQFHVSSRAIMEKSIHGLELVAFRRALGVPLKQATRLQVVAAARLVWPDASFPDEAESIELGDLTVRFDNLGRVIDSLPKGTRPA